MWITSSVTERELEGGRDGEEEIQEWEMQEGAIEAWEIEGDTK